MEATSPAPMRGLMPEVMAPSRSSAAQDGVVDARRQEQADHVAPGDPETGEVAGHAVGRPVPCRERSGSPDPPAVQLDVRLDVAIDPCRLPQDGHHRLVLIRWDTHWHGGRRWYQG